MFKRRNIRRKIPKYFYVISLGLLLFLGVGYSVINSNLSIQGNLFVSGNKWDIEFANITYGTDNYTTEEKVVTNNVTSLSLNIELPNPGDKYEFSFDITNKGTLDALIKTLNITQLTDEQKVYSEFKVTYEDDSEIELNDVLKKGDTKKVKVSIRYKNLRAKDLLPTSDVNVNIQISMTFYQPEEAEYNVQLIRNGTTTNYKTKNISQELALEDLESTENDKVIICDNGAVPTTDDAGLITIKHIKQDTTCRIESTLSAAVNNMNSTKSHATILDNNTETAQVLISETKDVTIDLNGKTLTINTATDKPSILDSGKLTMYDSKYDGKLIANYRCIQVLRGNLYIKNGIYQRINPTTTAGSTIQSLGGNVILNNATITSDKTWTIYTEDGTSNITINNCYVEATDASGIVTINVYKGDSNLDIRNSTIINKTYAIGDYGNSANAIGNIYLCNNSITGSSTNQVAKIRNNVHLYYATNNIVNNSGNDLIASEIEAGGSLIKSDIACQE